jgi:glycosyltransferase involved in cell wall biosynthesis
LRELTFDCVLCSWDGYGQAAAHLAKGLEPLGWSIRFKDGLKCEQFGDLDPWVADRIGEENAKTPLVVFRVPWAPLPAKGRPVIAFTMWETTLLPFSAKDNLNLAAAVIVPSSFCAATFSAAGVDQPLSVCPLGHDPDTFFPTVHRSPTPRIGLAGRRKHGGARKGIEEGIEAFLAAGVDAELSILSWPDDPPLPDHPRIKVRRDPTSGHERANWYRSLTAYLHPSKGEGFGLMPLEAMACGTPVICAAWGGVADYINAGNAYLVDYEIEPATGFYMGLGCWAVPSVEGMKWQIEQICRCPRPIARFDRTAARDMTWDASAKRLDSILRGILN